MTTTIGLIIVAVLVAGLGIWSWWFENGKEEEPENQEDSIEEKKK